MSFLIFLCVLSVLVIVHEWGHFVFARLFGIPVQRFSIGFGPTLLKRQIGETEFCVSLVPFGGYVKLEGEEPGEATGNPREFASRPRYQKFAVIFAGPLLNAVLAFVLFSGIYWIGHPAYSTRIGNVLNGYPAKAAGLEAGDRVVSFNGKPIRLWEELLIELHEARGAVTLKVERAGETLSIEIRPRLEEARTILGKRIRLGRIGVEPAGEVLYIKSGFPESIVLGFKKVAALAGLILASLGAVITGQLSFKESFAGPIGIYFLTEQAARLGWIRLVDFTASLSVSLFVLNLLPIPVLDGGHLFFILVESVIRKPVSEKLKERATQVGLYFLVGLAVLVIYQDLLKYGFVTKVRAIIGL